MENMKLQVLHPKFKYIHFIHDKDFIFGINWLFNYLITRKKIVQ